MSSPKPKRSYRDLQREVVRQAEAYEARIEVQRASIDRLLARNQQLEALVADLRARLDLGDEPCTCGWGGVHDQDNPRCARNQELRDADPDC